MVPACLPLIAPGAARAHGTGVRGVRLLSRNHAAPRPLVGGRGSREHDRDHEAVPIHDRGPHVEIEAPIVFIPGLDQRRLQLVKAGDPTQRHVECGSTDRVVAACRGGGETAGGDPEPHGFAGEVMETEHGDPPDRWVRCGPGSGRQFVIGVASQERRQGEGEEAVLGPSDEHGVPIRASRCSRSTPCGRWYLAACSWCWASRALRDGAMRSSL